LRGGTPTVQAAWGDEAIDALEAPVLGRHEAARFLSSIGKQGQARRMARYGSTRRRVAIVARLARRREHRPSARRTGRSLARRGPPGSGDPSEPDPAPPFASWPVGVAA
jgi:hypothetical protein